MDAKYVKAMARSYAGQQNLLALPAVALEEVVEIYLGFQPMGISVYKDMVLVACYFEPAIIIFRVEASETGLEFKSSWIRGVNNGVDIPRIFTQPGGGDANRAQTANYRGGKIYASRNGGKEIFILDPPRDHKAKPDSPEGRWNLAERHVLPTDAVVHSAVFHGGYFQTIESSGGTTSLDHWYHRKYFPREAFRLAGDQVIPEWTYGIGYRPGDETPYYVTDYRTIRPAGIYRGDELVLDKVDELTTVEWRGRPLQLVITKHDYGTEIYGNGICFLADGAALVTVYGQASVAPLGEPGKLVYIPARYFE